MGIEISRDRFDEADFVRFARQLTVDLRALHEVLARRGFGEGDASVGAELELHLIDSHGRPLAQNGAIVAESADARVVVEMDQFNLELNTLPVALRGHPFSALESQLEEGQRDAGRAGAKYGGRVVAIGILPTLELGDLVPGVLTDTCRYRALSAGVRRGRGRAFHVHVDGRDPLSIDADDVTLEGANASFQLHLRVAPEAFARTYNAAQIASAPAIAAGANSPTFLGHRLWDETRIALFRQSVDDRGPQSWRPARVSFGHGWVRMGAAELFEEAVALHAPLLPVVTDEDPLERLRRGEVPALEELRLHNGTVWRWNRPVYDSAGGGHLRIEMRALPAGPTRVDALASAAFLLGLTLGLAPDADAHIHRLTFGQARRKFYEAARHGLDAELLWPSSKVPSPEPTVASELILRLLPLARTGLRAGGVADDEIERWLSIVAARVASRQTGAEWQKGVAERVGLVQMFERYVELSAEERPVHTWPS